MAPTDYQQRMQSAAELGDRGAQQAEQQTASVQTPEEPREALGYWNAMIGIARHKAGELIDESRNSEPPVPWTEIGSALGISADAARQRWLYYKNESG